MLLLLIFRVLWSQAKKEKESKHSHSASDEDKVTSYLVASIIATVFTVGVLLILLIMRKKIQLVIQLIKEAAKAIAAMPLILFEPILVNVFSLL